MDPSDPTAGVRRVVSLFEDSQETFDRIARRLKETRDAFRQTVAIVDEINAVCASFLASVDEQPPASISAAGLPPFPLTS